MVLAASGSKSAAGATMRSAQQSNAPKNNTTNPRGPTGPSNTQPRSSPASGGSPGSVSRTPSVGSSRSSSERGVGSTTSRIGSAASAQRASTQASGNQGYQGGPPNAAAAKASAALNAGLGRPAPSRGALNTQASIAAPPSLPQTQPAQVRNYLGSGTASPFGGYQYGPGQMYSDPFRSKAALGSVINNTKLANMDPRQTSDAVLRSAGLTNPYARAGVLGTFDHESAGFNPNAVGDQGTAFGLAQWRGPRIAGLQKYSAGMGQPTGTVGLQTAYAMTEMGRSFPKTLNSLQAAQDVPSAVKAMNAYERPRGYRPGGNPEDVAGWADRLVRSNDALASLSAQSSTAPVRSATAAEEMTRRSWVNNQIGALYDDPAINRQLPNALGRGMWDLRISDANRVAQGQKPVGDFGERQMAPWEGAGFRTAEQAADNKRRGTGVAIDRSFHGVGLAADITVPRRPGESTKQWENRNAVANAALAETIDPASGVTWGGSWSKPDLSHFQLGAGSQRQAAIDKYGTNVNTAGVRPAEPVVRQAGPRQESVVDALVRAVSPPPTNTVPSWEQSSYVGRPNSIPSWYQGDYTGPTVTRGPLGSLENTVPSYRQSVYTGRPATVPSNEQSVYTGPIGYVMRDEPVNMPVKPYGSKMKAAINAAVGFVPIVGETNAALGAAGYSLGDYIVNEENKLANMTPEQRDRYRAYWSEKRNAAFGRESTRSDREVASNPTVPSTPQSLPAEPSQASGTWEADAMAYGYSQAQLKDVDTRALIKQLWDMGFIPKTPAPT